MHKNKNCIELKSPGRGGTALAVEQEGLKGAQGVEALPGQVSTILISVQSDVLCCSN